MEIHSALSDIGLYDGDPARMSEHDFRLAVQRFTWYLQNYKRRMVVSNRCTPSYGSVNSYSGFYAFNAQNTCTDNVEKEIIRWKKEGVMVTTMLVRVPIKEFSNISTNSNFVQMSGSAKGEIIVNIDFVPSLRAIDECARKNKVQILINQAFRDQKVSPTGAVYVPANKSQHYIGHALDLNIKDNNIINTSNLFIENRASSAAISFIKDVKSKGLRWGGDFKRNGRAAPDWPHFDYCVPSNSIDYDMKFYFCQKFYGEMHVMTFA